MLCRRTAQEQWVAVSNAAKGGTANFVDGDDAIDDDVVDATNHNDRAQPPKQHMQRHEFAASEEAAFQSCEREES